MIPDNFSKRHIGPTGPEIGEMLHKIGAESLDDLVGRTIPNSILCNRQLDLPAQLDENAYLERLRGIAGKNKLFRTYIGLGFYNTNLPPVIQRNILENPNWYTSYTPYQA
ncbi:MAG: glycine dehydrogenase (aminomethyl-transferring), partial [Bacteroidetes bacterium]